MAYTLKKGNVYAVPVLHYTMELAACVAEAFDEVQPDCVAVELPETMHEQCLHAAERLPDISVIVAQAGQDDTLYYLAEPCDAAFEGLRCALEHGVPGYCIDLDVEDYPEVWELLPDPYSIRRIGLQAYYENYRKSRQDQEKAYEDIERETYMARRLKELSLRYDRVLFVGGMAHVAGVFERLDSQRFPDVQHAERDMVVTATLTEDSCREVLAECGWFSRHYEENRGGPLFPPDRQQLIYGLYKQTAQLYEKENDVPFAGYNLRNLMHFARNYALVTNRLLPDFFQIMTTAKACVDDNYAYECWELATEYPYLKNVDGLEELDLSPEDIWGHSRHIRFQRKEKSPKSGFQRRERKDRSQHRFEPNSLFGICSYPPEDLVVEDFGTFLQKKGSALFAEEAARTVPFTSSLEDGVDTRETIRHWYEHKLYVKVQGRPTGGVGSVVAIFDEDDRGGKYSWRTTWLGEHEQESDMAFYATPMGEDIVGPGICRCTYGGFLMSYPPRRMYDVWQDPDYSAIRSKSEVLLAAAIDYAVKPLIIYVADKPPNPLWKSYASRYNKKVVYLPIGQLSPLMIRKIRRFHVLDGHDKRGIAPDYIH